MKPSAAPAPASPTARLAEAAPARISRPPAKATPVRIQKSCPGRASTISPAASAVTASPISTRRPSSGVQAKGRRLIAVAMPSTRSSKCGSGRASARARR